MSSTDSIMAAWHAKDATGNPIRFTMTEMISIIDMFLDPKLLEKLEATSSDYAFCVLMIGKPGHGKSAIAKQRAEKIGHEFHSWHVNCSPFEDLAGLQRQVEKTINGKKVMVSEHTRSTSVPGLLPPKKSKTGWMVLFHDEFCTATEEVQSILRQIISEKRVNELDLYPKIVHLAATNPDDGNHVTVKPMDAAVAGRTLPFPVEMRWNEFLAYHKKTGRLGTHLYTFMLLYKQFFEAASPRDWTNLGLQLQMMLMSGIDRNTLLKTLMCQIKNEVAVAFDKFLERGSDPNNYPILGETILGANTNQLRDLTARLDRWVNAHKKGDEGDEDRIAPEPLIGATVADLSWTLRDCADSSTKASREQLMAWAKNTSKILTTLGEGPYLEMAEELMFTPLHPEFQTNLAEGIVDTPVGARLRSAVSRFNARRQQVAEVKKRLEETAGVK